MIFFTYFGIFAFIGLIIVMILVSKELKKQLPSEAERELLINSGLIQPEEKDKKILRTQTQTLRAVLMSVQVLKSNPRLENLVNEVKKVDVPFNVLNKDM